MPSFITNPLRSLTKRKLNPWQIAIPGADIRVKLAEGESIWTETSHKFSLTELQHVAATCGFRWPGVWTDDSWPFSDCLLVAG